MYIDVLYVFKLFVRVCVFLKKKSFSLAQYDSERALGGFFPRMNGGGGSSSGCEYGAAVDLNDVAMG